MVRSILVLSVFIITQSAYGACLIKKDGNGDLKRIPVNTLPAAAGSKPIYIHHTDENTSHPVFPIGSYFKFSNTLQLTEHRPDTPTTITYQMQSKTAVLLGPNGQPDGKLLRYWASAANDLFIYYRTTQACDITGYGTAQEQCRIYVLEKYNPRTRPNPQYPHEAQWRSSECGGGAEPPTGGGTEPPP